MTLWSMRGINKSESSISDGIYSMVIHCGILQQNLSMSMTDIQLRCHCMEHNSFFMEEINMTWSISKTDMSPVCRLSYATAAFWPRFTIIDIEAYLAFMIMY